jgi:hypothetical protein
VIDLNPEMGTRAKQMTRKESTIWAAGFLDGEGFVGVSSYRHGQYRTYSSVIVDAAQNKPEPLQRLAVLRACLPYFAAKRQVAELVVGYFETKDPGLLEAIKALTARRKVQAERLSPEAPEKGDAIVRPYVN